MLQRDSLRQGVPTEMMIDTGANISLIDKTELNRIQEIVTERIPTLPIHNITIIGATGKQNKTIKQQVILQVASKGIGIPMVFLAVSYTHLIRRIIYNI